MKQQRGQSNREPTAVLKWPPGESNSNLQTPSRTDGGASTRVPAPVSKWEAKTGDRIRSSPAVDHASVYVGGSDGVLYAFDRDTGSLQWHYETESERVHPPQVLNDTVYAASGEALMAFDPTTGDRLWAMLDRRIMERPIVSGATAYFYAVDRDGWRLHAIDTASKKAEWTHEEGFDTDTHLQANIIVTEQILATATWSALRAFDRQEGTPVWTVPHDGSIEAINYDGNLIYCGCRTGELVSNILAIEPETGEVRWKSLTRAAEWITGLTSTDTQLFASGIEPEGGGTKTRRVTAMSASDGEVLWRRTIDRSNSSVPPRPVAHFGNVLIATGGRQIVILAADSGEILDRIDVEAPVHTEPTVVDGVMYIGDENGTITAYDGLE